MAHPEFDASKEWIPTPPPSDHVDCTRPSVRYPAQQQQMHTSHKPLLLFSLLAVLCLSLVSAESGREKFNVLAKKSPNGIIPLDSKLYEEITAGDRDWAVIVQLTAMGKEIKCQPCQCVFSLPAALASVC